MARFGLPALLPATTLARLRFREPAARALFAGMSAHSMLRLGQPLSRVVRARARAARARASAGRWRAAGAARSPRRSRRRRGRSAWRSRPGRRVASLGGAAGRARGPVRPDAAPDARGRGRPAAGRLPAPARGLPLRPRRAQDRLGARRPDPVDRPARRCGPATVHLGGTMREVAAAEDAVHRGRIAERPFVLLVQPTIADPTRAPAGKHVAWAYCHVPNGSDGRRDRARSRPRSSATPRASATSSSRGPSATRAAMEAYDANYVGGDINGGVQDVRQLLFRPVVRWNPYTTPDPGLFLCSSSTPPGGGVHGMCGVHAPRAAMAGHVALARPKSRPESKPSATPCVHANADALDRLPCRWPAS